MTDFLHSMGTAWLLLFAVSIGIVSNKISQIKRGVITRRGKIELICFAAVAVAILVGAIANR